MRSNTLVTNEEKATLAIQAILEESLNIALKRISKLYPDIDFDSIIPIILSRFVCRELFILSLDKKIPLPSLRDVFVKLLDTLVENNPDASKD